MYDIIGDVHGHAQLLKLMLLELGYKKTLSGYSHPERKAVFVGDFINRGPDIRKVIRTIRTMVENGNALAILGNHEINIIISHIRNKSNIFNRNDISELKTVEEFRNYPDEWKDHVKWLRSLPLFLEINGIRVVHACWSEESIHFVRQNIPQGRIKKEVFRQVYKTPDSLMAKHIWQLTKGVQFRLPSDLKIKNNKGTFPRSFRMRWWEDPRGKTFEELSFESKFAMPGYTIPAEILSEGVPYPENDPIVFFGHYCRHNGPFIIKPNICCIDACINGSKTLMAYRWGGETSLLPENLIQVKK